MLITDKTWSLFARHIASPGAPEDYNQEAVNRLMDKLDDRVVRVKGVKTQFRARNESKLIQFQSREDAEYYHKALERYQREKAKIEAREDISAGEANILILVQFLLFRKAAEYVRAPYLAKEMWEAVNKRGKAAACACNFKGTITRAEMILINDYNIPRDKTSIIWGGSAEAQTKKGKLKKKITEAKGLAELLAKEGITLESINLGDDVEIKENQHFDPSLRMGGQTRDARQYEIDQFQRGNSLYCFFTFKAGGVGLSLHHTDEWTDVKCRRKESGYVYEEDVKLISTRPREVFLAPTYSAIELVQGLGRCPRLTSLSDTVQTLLYFAGTIEEWHVMPITNAKLGCLSKVVRMHEHWEDLLTARDINKAKEEIMGRTSTLQVDPTDEDDGIIGDVGSDYDDEEEEE